MKILSFCLIFATSTLACDLSQKKLEKKHKKSIEEKIKKTYRTFILYDVSEIKKVDEKNYVATIRFRERGCKKIQYTAEVDKNCRVSANVQTIQGCLNP